MNSRSSDEDIRALSYFVNKSSKQTYPDLKLINLLSSDLLFKTNHLEHPLDFSTQTSKEYITMPVKKIKIFIASQSFLHEERDIVETYIRQANDETIEENIYLKPERWEQQDSGISARRKQEDYSDLLKECDILVLILQSTLGFFSKEEFMLAYERMTNGEKPKRIYIFDKFIPRTIDEHEMDSMKDYMELKKKMKSDQQLIVSFTDPHKLEADLKAELRKMVQYIVTNKTNF